MFIILIMISITITFNKLTVCRLFQNISQTLLWASFEALSDDFYLHFCHKYLINLH